MSERGLQRPDSEATGARCVVCDSTENVRTYRIESEYPNQDVARDVPLCKSHYLTVRAHSSDPTETHDRDAASPTGVANADTQKVTTRVPKPLLDALDQIAGEAGQSRSDLIREYVRRGVESEEADLDVELLVGKLERARSATEDLEDRLDTTETADAEEVQFLRERVENLESLLEDAIGKI